MDSKFEELKSTYRYMGFSGGIGFHIISMKLKSSPAVTANDQYIYLEHMNKLRSSALSVWASRSMGTILMPDRRGHERSFKFKWCSHSIMQLSVSHAGTQKIHRSLSWLFDPSKFLVVHGLVTSSILFCNSHPLR